MNEFRIHKQKTPYDSVASFILLATIFLAPFFFIPSKLIDVATAKSYLLVWGITSAFIFFLIGRLVEGKFSLSKKVLPVLLIVLSVLTIISSLAGGHTSKSLFGISYEVGGAVSLVLMIITAFLVAEYASTKTEISRLLLYFLIGSGVTSIFQLVLLIVGPQALHLYPFVSKGVTLIGSGYDFIYFQGFSVILSVFLLEFLTTKIYHKILIGIILTASSLFVFFSGFKEIWMLVGAVCFLYFVYSLIVIWPKQKEKRTFPFVSFIIVVVSLFFIFGSTSFGSKVNTFFDISSSSVRPSFATTLETALPALAERPLLGSGPLSFSSSWQMWKPASVRTSTFWNTDFHYGFGTLSTSMIETGLIATVLWIALFVAFFFSLYTMAFRSEEHMSKSHLPLFLFVASMFLFASIIFFVVGTLVVFLAFILLGIVIGMRRRSLKEVYHVSLLKDPRTSILGVLSLSFILLLSLGSLFVSFKKATAFALFQKGQTSTTNQARYMARALSLDGNDAYARTLAAVFVKELQAIPSSSLSTADKQAAIKLAFQNALVAKDQALRYDSSNSFNWIMAGNVYASVVPYKAEGAYEGALSAYDEALKRSSDNPAILLLLARLEDSHGDSTKAKEYLDTAISLKPDFIEAILFKADIEVEKGNSNGGMGILQSALQSYPRSPDILLALGVLYYNTGQFDLARQALERAVSSNPTSLNAHYVLALTYSRLGQSSNALDELGYLKAVLPDNKEIESAYDAVSRGTPVGQAPFQGEFLQNQ